MSVDPSLPVSSQTTMHALVDDIEIRQERPTVRSRLAAFSEKLPPWASQAFFRMALISADSSLAHEAISLQEALGFSSEVGVSSASMPQMKSALRLADRRSIVSSGADRTLKSLLGRDGRWWRNEVERQVDNTWWSAAVDIWTKQGFLTESVVVADADLHAMLFPKAKATAESVSGRELMEREGAPSIVRMAIDRRGSMGFSHFQPMPASVPAAREVGWNRLSILAHELAHTVFSGIDDPFRPSGCLPNSAPDQSRQGEGIPTAILLLKDFFRAPYVNDAPYSANTLNEAFADVYGAMMVLESCGHDPEVVAHWEAVAAIRLAEQGQMEACAALQGDLREKEALVHPQWDNHATGSAVAAMLAYRDQWQGSSPTDLRDLALRLASDHVVLLCHPDRQTVVSWRAAPAAHQQRSDSFSGSTFFQETPLSEGSNAPVDRTVSDIAELSKMAKDSLNHHVWSVQNSDSNSVLHHVLRPGRALPAMILFESQKNTFRFLVRASLRAICKRDIAHPSGIPVSVVDSLVHYVVQKWETNKKRRLPSDELSVFIGSSKNRFSRVGRRLRILSGACSFSHAILEELNAEQRFLNSSLFPDLVSPFQCVEHALIDRGNRIVSALKDLALQHPAPLIQADLVLPVQPDRPLPDALASLVKQDIYRLNSTIFQRMDDGLAAPTTLTPLLMALGRQSFGHKDRVDDQEFSGDWNLKGKWKSDCVRPWAVTRSESSLGEMAVAEWLENRRHTAEVQARQSLTAADFSHDQHSSQAVAPVVIPAGQSSCPELSDNHVGDRRPRAF